MEKRGRALGLILLTLFSGRMVFGQVLPTARCPESSFRAAFEGRLERHSSARTPSELRALMNNPTRLLATAERVDHPDARIETTSDYHVVYPFTVAQFLSVSQDDQEITRYAPNLVRNEVLCENPDGLKQVRQRSELSLLPVANDLVLAVQDNSSDDRSGYSMWALSELLEGQVGYLYGSVYAETVELDGREVVYVRHYARTGLDIRFPGARALAGSQIDGSITRWFNAMAEETAARFGGTQ